MPPVEIHCLQGRLGPPEGAPIQAFPLSRWRAELALAPSAGLAGLEWVYGPYGARENPIMTAAGRGEIRREAERHGVAVRSLCADWFKDHPLVRDPDAGPQMRHLIEAAGDAGITRVVMPCIENARLRTAQDADTLVRVVSESIGALERTSVELHLETDLGPDAFADLLERIPHPLVCVNYDTGDSASRGFDPRLEWEAYGARIGSVHIKDRVRDGITVPLGEGDADIAGVIDLLIDRQWDRPLVLQVARGSVGDEVSWVRAARDRVAELWGGHSMTR